MRPATYPCAIHIAGHLGEILLIRGDDIGCSEHSTRLLGVRSHAALVCLMLAMVLTWRQELSAAVSTISTKLAEAVGDETIAQKARHQV